MTRTRRCYSGGCICVLKSPVFTKHFKRGIQVGIGSYGRPQSGKASEF